MNITLDFTKQSTINAAIEQQPVAVMPATLAQKLLRLYATKMKSSRASDIINNLIGDLRTCAEHQDVDMAKSAVLSWAAERELINNIEEENWEAYTVTTRTVHADSEEAEAIH
jgi:arginine repressor